jgi:hypothetical protein
MKTFIQCKVQLLLAFFMVLASDLQAQNYSIILGRPTNQSITASVLFDANAEAKIVYSTDSNQLKMFL